MALAEDLEVLGWDLLYLEINTIVQPTMRASKMPPAGHAVLDIVRDYEAWLCARQCDWSDLDAELEAKPSVVGGGPRRLKVLWDGSSRVADAEKIDALRTLAQRLAPRVATLQERAIVGRIVDNCGALRAMLAGARGLRRGYRPEDELRLSPGGRRQLRKIWDLGVEEILAQTLVGVDGDVTTRVAERLVGEPKAAAVLEVHHFGVRLATEQWSELIRVGAELLSHLTRGVAGLVRR